MRVSCSPGIATALKILFSSNDMPPAQPGHLPDLSLERNEVIALVNLLGRFANALHKYHQLSLQLLQQEGLQPVVSHKSALA